MLASNLFLLLLFFLRLAKFLFGSAFLDTLVILSYTPEQPWEKLEVVCWGKAPCNWVIPAEFLL